MRLTIYGDGRLVATMPGRMRESIMEDFISEKADWILKKIEHFRIFYGRRWNRQLLKVSQKEYEKRRQEAQKLIEEKISSFNETYGFSYNKIFVRNQKTRWGSCSQKGNLSFNYKIVFLPVKLANYIVVHELCHLREFNHSSKFWKLVEKTIPDYKKLRKEVRKL